MVAMKNQVVIHNAATRQWLHFQAPQQVIAATCLAEVVPSLRRVEKMVHERGLVAAGFISYEAAPAFDPALQVHPLDSFPLLWFGLYSRPDVIQIPSSPSDMAYTALDWTPSVSRSAYDQALAQIKSCIAHGETYQVNYTLRLRAPFSGEAWPFFQALAAAQQADYVAYVDTGRFAICSASPELFFQLDGDHLVSRPMKGTAARGLTLADDETQAQWLQHSEKNRAENVMIVDMIRNDMGRVATTGTVQVPRLFDVERYPTLWQMTSTVTATTDAALTEIMTALFPCASITGAPKPRTMQIINNLETTPRRVYTGCIGFFTPHRQAQFNVAIRTVLIDRDRQQAEYGVGGGIVWDSVSGEEYTECQTKARILTERRPDFSLLETMLWTPDEGYFLLDYHLRRMRNSAVYFVYPLDQARVQQKLAELVEALPPARHRVRLLLARNGTVSAELFPLIGTDISQPARLKLAPTPVDSTDAFLYHKTTHRQVYEAAQTACPDCDDVLLWNERGEITETCIANVVVELEGELFTPPVQSGLLAGTFRTWLLDRGEIKERVISIDDLKQSGQIYVINSVRKWRNAFLTG
jgi:para-aminobenzoate synthetase/4-amino-4-deoxychorismate lyase